MFCATCGKQIDEQDAFCRNCGRRVPSSAPATPTPAAESDTTTGRFTVRHFALLLLGVAILVVWVVLRQPPDSSATRPALPQPSQNQSNTQITPKEKEALGWLIRDAKTVFDHAQTVARGQAAFVDLRETHRNLISLEVSAQGALADLDNKWVPDSLRPASQIFGLPCSICLRGPSTSFRTGRPGTPQTLNLAPRR